MYEIYDKTIGADRIMKEIKAWQTNDESIFTDEQAALKHEMLTDYHNALKKLIESEINGTYGATTTDVFDFLINNQDTLYQIFNLYRR